MNTREIFFKAYSMLTKPTGSLYYTYRNQKTGKIDLGQSLWLVFEKEYHEDNIEQMKMIEKIPGFLFWNISDDGDKFVKMHSEEIKHTISNMILMQR